MNTHPIVNSQPAPLQEEPAGHVETAVRSLARKISAALPGKSAAPSAISFEKNLLEALRRRALAPWVICEQFKHFVPEEERKNLYDNLGRGRPLPYSERLWNWLFRDKRGVRAYFYRVGHLEAKNDCYRHQAPLLEKALRAICETP